MIIRPNFTAQAFDAAERPSARRQDPAAETAVFSDMVTITQRALELSSSAKGSTTNSTDARLAEIKSKDAASRTGADMDFLIANDKKFAEIREKQNSGVGITSSEMAYVEKASGLPNTMAFLSAAEKGLYDELVARGNTTAAAGLSAIAHIRAGVVMGGISGTTYDPINTVITPKNIKDLFRQSIVDPSGVTKGQFQALISYLENKPGIS